ncbi:hypothetical protein ONS95_014555 [Cadophora gregata]|uniref:uncharacterized protein n=1 Tax=Cadophora gregata TaxID=51156 RepID=UPI0026DCE3CD|nr:uncharacterized protein ONS95_014555 [Cadophora gregata]KAK0112828.1 hypothetical protein ONS95_014555 [Cadophora gregata]
MSNPGLLLSAAVLSLDVVILIIPTECELDVEVHGVEKLIKTRGTDHVEMIGQRTRHISPGGPSLACMRPTMQNFMQTEVKAARVLSDSLSCAYTERSQMEKDQAG